MCIPRCVGGRRGKDSLSLSGEPKVTMVQELTEIEKLTENSDRNREWTLQAPLCSWVQELWNVLRMPSVLGSVKPWHLSNQSTIPEQIPILNKDKKEEPWVNGQRRAEEEDFRNFKVIFKNYVVKIIEDSEPWSSEARNYILIYDSLLKWKLISFKNEWQKSIPLTSCRKSVRKKKKKEGWKESSSKSWKRDRKTRPQNKWNLLPDIAEKVKEILKGIETGFKKNIKEIRKNQKWSDWRIARFEKVKKFSK